MRTIPFSTGIDRAVPALRELCELHREIKWTARYELQLRSDRPLGNRLALPLLALKYDMPPSSRCW